MGFFDLIEGLAAPEKKLKEISERIKQGSIEHQWSIKSFGFIIEPKKEFLTEEKGQLYLNHIISSFNPLKEYSEKLDYYNKYPELFEFPFLTFKIEKEHKLSFEFDFKPQENTHEVYLYNIWFLKRSKQFLLSPRKSIKDLPFISHEEMWASFLKKKNSIQLLNLYIKQERKDIKAHMDNHFLNRFSYLYGFRIKETPFNFHDKIITTKFWPDLLILQYIEYSYRLDLYKKNKGKDLYLSKSIHNEDETSQLQNKSEGSIEVIPDETLFYDLFKGNRVIANNFIQILKNYKYLSESGSWIEISRPGIILPIVELLEDNELILKLKKTRLKAALESKFGPIMTDRNFRNKDHYFELDKLLIRDLLNLKRY